MAVFTSFSDESSGKDVRSKFLIAGWVGPEKDWPDSFVPAWDKQVLAGPPRIPRFHMTDLRCEQWREDHGLTESDAENWIDQARLVPDRYTNLHPISTVMDAGNFRDEFPETGFERTAQKQYARAEFEPDHLGFLGYAWSALRYLEEHHPEVERLDFVVERNGKITNCIRDFHLEIPVQLVELGHPELAKLVGTFASADKECPPLQAADLLCWHTARNERPETMMPLDTRRYETLRRDGCQSVFSEQMLRQLRAAPP